MTKQYDNTNRGAAWPNNHKKTDKHPDFTGSLDVDGVDYKLSIWMNENPEGRQPVFRLAVTMKDDQPNLTETRRRQGMQQISDILDKEEPAW